MINTYQNTKNMEKSFFKYVIPAIVSTMLGGLYIVVDGFFVGNSMGDNGLTAINLVYPIGTLIAACAVMLGMGGSVIMSTYLGGGDNKYFNKAKSNTFITLILACIILTIILLLLKNKLIYLLGARDNVFKLADEYITVIILGGSFQIISYGSMPIIRNYGSVIYLFEGIAEGCQPMISYFKGAQRNDLMKKVFKKGVLFALIIASIILSIILIFKNNFGILFGASIETNDIISKGLILISVSFILQPIVRLGTAYFYSSGESRYSTLLTYIDPLFVSPLCILVLPLFFNLNGVWLALPFSQFILIVLFILIFYNTNIKDKDFIKKTVYQNE